MYLAFIISFTYFVSTTSGTSGFKGKTAVVTGAGNGMLRTFLILRNRFIFIKSMVASGIGLATALPLISKGCKVIAVDLAEKSLAKLKSSCVCFIFSKEIAKFNLR